MESNLTKNQGYVGVTFGQGENAIYIGEEAYEEVLISLKETSSVFGSPNNCEAIGYLLEDGVVVQRDICYRGKRLPEIRLHSRDIGGLVKLAERLGLPCPCED